MGNLKKGFKNAAQALLRVLQGAIIGMGAILPGISGGVLAVVFGIYRPMMESLTHPKAGLKKYWSLFLFIGLGWAIGFLGCSGAISAMLEANETVATWVFIGLILGTVPMLWKEAGEQGRSAGSYAALIVSSVLFFALLVYVQVATFAQIRPGFWAFAFCGGLWGLSLIMPGMTSSSIMMATGLLEPMTEGISRLNMGVLLPWLLGLIVVVVTLSRLADFLFRKHYSIMYHIIFGITLASTLAIVPIQYSGTGEILLSVVCGVAGIAIGYLCSRIGQEKN